MITAWLDTACQFISSLQYNHWIFFTFLGLFIVSLDLLWRACCLPRTQTFSLPRVGLVVMIICIPVLTYAWLVVYIERLWSCHLILSASNTVRISMPFGLLFRYVSGIFIVGFLSRQYTLTKINKGAAALLSLASMYVLSQLYFNPSKYIEPGCSENVVMIFSYVVLTFHTLYSLGKISLHFYRVGLPRNILVQKGALFGLATLCFLEIFTLCCGVLWRLDYIIAPGNELVIGSFAILLLTMYSFIRNVDKYRFLNINKRIKNRKRYPALSISMMATSKLQKAESIFELESLAQVFCEKSFKISPDAVQLRIRPLHPSEEFTDFARKQPQAYARVDRIEEYCAKSPIPRIEDASIEDATSRKSFVRREY